MDTPPDRAPLRAPPRWFERVLPLTVVVLVVLALAVAVVPSLRHQADLSLSRQPEPSVELYFARSPSGTQAVCTRTGSRVRVSFVVTSHLTTRRVIAYRAVVDPVKKGLRSHRGAGSQTVSPGRSFEVTRVVRLPPRAAYVVTVSLPGTDQELRAHCRGAA